MDKSKLRERGFFITLLSNFTKSLKEVLSSVEGGLEKKVFRVRFENEKYLLKPMEKISSQLEKMAGGNMEYKQVGSVMVEGVETMKLDSIQKIEVKELSQKDVIEKLGKVQEEVSRVVAAVDKLPKKDISIPAYPKQMAVGGTVGVSALPERIHAQLSELKQSVGMMSEALKSLKLEVPQTDIVFPKEISISNLQALQKDLQEVKKSVEGIQFPKVEFPDTINVGNFPPQKVPQPVTNININPLKGTIKNTAVTVSSTATPLPETPAPKRKSVVIFNNSTSVAIYLGGAEVTAENGLPVLAQSYSPAIDAGDTMLLYGITESGTADIRVLEANNEGFGI